MGVLRLGTFDAERAWRPADLAELPGIDDPHAARVVTALDETLAVLCWPGDVLMTHEPLPPHHREMLAAAGLVFRHRIVAAPVDAAVPTTVVPYAWLPATVDLAIALGTPAPPAAKVAAVNSKTWSNGLVVALKLPGAGDVVRSSAALDAALAGKVVVKDPYGVAGRGCVEVAVPGVRRALVRTVARQEAAGRPVELLIQPWLDKWLDLSAHFDLAPDGQMTWRGVAVGCARAGYGYGGSRPASRELIRTLAALGHRSVMVAVGEHLAAAGYFGPVCVDGLLLADGRLVPVLEINARLSMGRLCLEMDRRVQPHGLRAGLGVRDVSVPDAMTSRRLVDALAAAGALHRTGGPGLLPLAAGTLRAPRGRVVYAVVAGTDAEAEGLERTLDRALGEAGLGVRAA